MTESREHDSVGASVPASAFSVRDFAESAHGSHRAHLNLEHFVEHPLPAETLELLAGFAALEHGSLRYLRSVLVSPLHKDTRITAFLVSWAYEKYWVADAWEQILAAHPEFAPSAPKNRPWLVRLAQGFSERTEPIVQSVVTNIRGEDTIAAHMTVAAVDEWVMGRACERLIEKADDPELRRVTEMLREVKHRHEDFFTAQANDRLEKSSRAVDLAIRRVRGIQWPLGLEETSQAFRTHLYTRLLEPKDIASIDHRAATLLGVQKLLVTRTVDRVRARSSNAGDMR